MYTIRRKIILICLVLASWMDSSYAAGEHVTIKTADNSYIFSIDIATTPKQQARGLMHRSQLPDDYGMLFVVPKPRPMSMWMKDTPHSLDMLFIDAKGKIVYIASNTTPNSTAIISADKPVKAVLELSGGVTTAKHIEVGDSVIHPYFKP